MYFHYILIGSTFILADYCVFCVGIFNTGSLKPENHYSDACLVNIPDLEAYQIS